MKRWIDDEGQEYGFDTQDMRLFEDETMTMELSLDSISKKALAEIIGGEPIIRCIDCKWNESRGDWVECPMSGMYGRKASDNYCSVAERKRDEDYRKGIN